jgi:hypothetical protein
MDMGTTAAKWVSNEEQGHNLVVPEGLKVVTVVDLLGAGEL